MQYATQVWGCYCITQVRGKVFSPKVSTQIRTTKIGGRNPSRIEQPTTALCGPGMGLGFSKVPGPSPTSHYFCPHLATLLPNDCPSHTKTPPACLFPAFLKHPHPRLMSHPSSASTTYCPPEPTGTQEASITPCASYSSSPSAADML